MALMLYNPYVEEFILMGVMYSSDLADYIFSEVDTGLFYILQNQILFETMVALYLDRNSISSVTIIQKLEDKHLLEQAGGSQRILNLSKLIIPVQKSVLRDYISILKDKATKRHLSSISQYINQAIHENVITNEEILDNIETSAMQVRALYTKTTINKLSELVIPTLSQMKEDNSTISKYTQFLTGFPSLDKFITGLERGNLIIIAGRPAMGKTAFGLALTLKVAMQDPSACMMIFSLEMSKNQLLQRLMSMETKIPSYVLKQQKLYDNSIDKLSRLFPTIFKSSIYIDDNFSININEIRSSIKRILSQQKRVDFILLDYLQLLGGKSENRSEELGYITRSLKRIAKEFQVPVVALSQLNRKIEQRINKQPLLSDLRESGCLCLNTSAMLEDQPQESEMFFKLKVLNLCLSKIRSEIIFKLFHNGKKHLFCLHIAGGIFLKATANHKILTKNGWRQVAELSRKDLLYVIVSDKINPQNTTLISRYKPQLIYYCERGRSFDVMSPPFMNFIVNNVVTHNSIEQDADIVLMLHRQSYHSSENFEKQNIPEDKQNTEIFIAKNRNGPTGKINLIFKTHIALFEENS